MDSQVDRLEGIAEGEVKGGLVIKKKQPTGDAQNEEHVFKKPRISVFGLDKLAAAKRKEREEQEKAGNEADDRKDDKQRRDERQFRKPRIETPSHTGGVSDDYRERRKERDERRDKQRSTIKSRDDNRDRHDKWTRDDERVPYRRDQIRTPSRSTWDDDDDEARDKDKPRSDWSVRSDRRNKWWDDTPSGSTRDRNRMRTPRATPQYWESSTRSHRRPDTERSERRGGNYEVDEEEIKRRDREWYDEDYDHNPFGNMSEEFVKAKEEALQKSKVVQRISAQQRQINKDNEKWETNRMLLSGVVTKLYDGNEDSDDFSQGRVHLMVHNIVPPFLDGRIVFTKQPEPVVPVKDPTSDMAILSKKGSALVRYHREMKERKKAQKKEWELAGTRIGEIMGVEKPKEETLAEEDDSYKAGQRFKDHMDDQL